jgi:hypothetical protein
MQLHSYNSVMCTLMVEETSEHLFLECPFCQRLLEPAGYNIPE